MLRDDDIKEQIGHLFKADAEAGAEIYLRRALVLFSGIAMWIGLSDPIYLAWGFAYVIGDVAYVASIRHASRTPSLTSFVVAHLFSLVMGLLIGGMAIYLSVIEGGALYFPSVCIVVGQALHCLSSHERFSVAARVDLLAVSITTAGMTAAAVLHAPTPQLGVGIAMGAMAVLVYFAHSLRKTIAQREELNRRIAQEQQGEKMRALGQLTSGVAHDFNNLLTVIGGNIELAQLQPVPDDARVLLTDAAHASQNAALLVSRLLAYARKSNLSAAVHACDDAFARIEALGKRVLPANITFRVAYPGPDVQLYVDTAMLETALLNLIVNARDAIGDAQGHISVFAAEDRAAGRVQISVTDTGPGMDSSALEQAADPFFTTKGVGEGSGLGLSMVKGFAEQSGGALILENRTGPGLRATLMLPAVGADPRAA